MKTEKVYIQHLMEKFMDNATSVDEERVLKEYFSTHDDIPEDWSAHAILFRGFCLKSSVAAKKHRTIPLYKYVAAAACVLLVVAGSILLLQQRGLEATEHTTAKVEEEVNDNPGGLLAQDTSLPFIKAEQTALSKSKNTSDKAISTKTPHASTTMSSNSSLTESSTDSDISSHGSNAEAELLPALFNEIESRMALERLREEDLHRAAIEEVYAHIVENPDGPQLTL